MAEDYSERYVPDSIRLLNIRIELSGNFIYGILPDLYNYRENTNPFPKQSDSDKSKNKSDSDKSKNKSDSDKSKNKYGKVYNTNRFYISIELLEQFNKLRDSNIPLQEFFLNRQLLEDFIYKIPELREYLIAEGFVESKKLKEKQENEKSIADFNKNILFDEEEIHKFDTINVGQPISARGGAAPSLDEKFDTAFMDATKLFSDVEDLLKNYRNFNKAPASGFAKVVEEAQAKAAGKPKGAATQKDAAKLREKIAEGIKEIRNIVERIKSLTTTNHYTLGPPPQYVSASDDQKLQAKALIKRGREIILDVARSDIQTSIGRKAKGERTKEEDIFKYNLDTILNIFFIRNKIFYVGGQKFKIIKAMLKLEDYKAIQKKALEYQVTTDELEEHILNNRRLRKINHLHKQLINKAKRERLAQIKAVKKAKKKVTVCKYLKKT